MFENDPIAFDKAVLMKFIEGFMRDRDGNNLIGQMNIAGIEKSVLLVIDGAFGFKESVMNIRRIHKIYFNVQKQHPGRFEVFAGVDPRRGARGVRFLRRCIDRFHISGIKLYPPMGFPIDDIRLLPYLELCNENKLCVLMHSGPSQNAMCADHANPVLIKSFARQFPDINFIMAHGALLLTPELVAIVKDEPNVFVDMAGFQLFQKESESIKEIVSRIQQEGLSDKTIFGSDWPLFNILTPLQKSIKALQAEFEYHQYSQEQINQIFYLNALKVLKQ